MCDQLSTPLPRGYGRDYSTEITTAAAAAAAACSPSLSSSQRTASGWIPYSLSGPHFPSSQMLIICGVQADFADYCYYRREQMARLDRRGRLELGAYFPP